MMSFRRVESLEQCRNLFRFVNSILLIMSLVLNVGILISRLTIRSVLLYISSAILQEHIA